MTSLGREFKISVAAAEKARLHATVVGVTCGTVMWFVQHRVMIKMMIK